MDQTESSKCKKTFIKEFQLLRNLLDPDCATSSEKQFHTIASIRNSIANQELSPAILHFFDTIISGLESGAFVPKPADLDNSQPSGSVQTDTDGLFYSSLLNSGQKKAVLSAFHNTVTVVEGAPGCGNSTAISEIINNFLAQGKRILVTAKTDRSLTHITRYIPKELRSLCSSIISREPDTPEALLGLRQSRAAIANLYSKWKDEDHKKRLAKLHIALKTALSNKKEILNRLASLRAREGEKHYNVFGRYYGTPAEIAKQLQDEKEVYGWLEDRPDRAMRCPIKKIEGLRLVQLAKQMKRGEVADKQPLGISKLWSPLKFRKYVKQEIEMKSRLTTCEQYAEQFSRIIAESDLGINPKLTVDLLDKLEFNMQSLSGPHDWIFKAIHDRIVGNDVRWKKKLNESRVCLEDIDCMGKQFDGLAVTNADGHHFQEIIDDATALLQHINYGNRLGFWIFRPRSVKRGDYILNEILIDGTNCRTAPQLQSLITWAQYQLDLKKLTKIWSADTQLQSDSTDLVIQNAANCTEILKSVVELGALLKRSKRLMSILKKLSPEWNASQLRALAFALRGVFFKNQLEKLNRHLSDLLSSLLNGPSTEASNSLFRQLSMAISDRDPVLYEKVYGDACELFTNAADQEFISISKKLQPHAPKLVKAIMADPDNDHWTDRMNVIKGAWTWARTYGWMQRHTDCKRQDLLLFELSKCRKQITDLQKAIIAERAWANYFNEYWPECKRLNPGNNNEYNVQNTGISTSNAITEFPLWIVPFDKIAELISPEKGCFDVAIVAQADQLGPEAMLIAYLADKTVLFGCEPDTDFSGEENVEFFNLNASFYRLMRERFGIHSSLKEQFCSVPELVSLWGNCSGQKDVVPLRISHMREHIPPLSIYQFVDAEPTTTQVTDENGKVRDILEVIKDYCRSPAYKDKTFGFVGMEKGSYIDQLQDRLMYDLGLDIWKRKRMYFGVLDDDFSARSRDVIFFNLRSSKTEQGRKNALLKIPLLARDHLCLFTNSIGNFGENSSERLFLEQSLKIAVSKPCESSDLLNAHKFAFSMDRLNELPPKPFRSWFEFDVYVKLTELGYELGSHVAGLAFKGKNTKILNCAGEVWEEQSVFEERMDMEGRLENLGIKCMHVSAAGYYWNRDECLNKITS